MKTFTASILTLLSVILPHFVQAQDELAVLPYWKYYNTQPGALYRHLCDEAFGQLAQRKKEVAMLKTPQDWQRRQGIVREKLQESIGAFPQRTPLNAVVTGKVERDGILVEKLYYESMPNYYVTAALFLPAGKRQNLPAIIFCSGHGPTAFRSGIYQQMILNYVQKGFAVLAFDPIGQGERIQYAKSESDKRFSGLRPTHEHSYPGAQSFVAGTSPALFFIWDGIRAVDYLLSRPEIDGKRIGITGRSGGGTQSAYIAAMDNRIMAAAPECYLTTYNKLLRSNGPQDSEQILNGMLAKGLDLADLVEVRAPLPMLMVTTTRDMFSIDGARELFDEAKVAYLKLGAGANLEKVEDDAPHASTKKNREATYTFFQKHLNNPGSNADMAIPPFTANELRVTTTGNVYTSLKGESLISLVKKRVAALPVHSITDVRKLREQVIALTGYVQPKLEEVIFSGKFPRQGYDVERYLVKGPGSYYLPVLWFRPHLKSSQIILYVDSKGKGIAGQKNGAVEQMVTAGYHVVLPDLSGAGELSNTYIQGGDSYIDSTSLNLWFTGILTKKSLVGVRMEEIQLISQLIRKKVEDATITGIGVGSFVPDMLHIALLDPLIERLVLSGGLASYRSLIEEEQYLPRFIPSVVPGAITVYDLPDLVKGISPRKVWVSGLMNGAGIQIPANDKIYSGHTKHIEFLESTESGTEVIDLMKWLKKNKTIH